MIKTKGRILQAAIKLWSKNAGASLEDIANEIGISRRTLHRHYKGREDLVLNVLNHLVDEYLKTVEEHLQHKDSSLVDRLKRLFYNDIRSADNYLVYSNLRKTDYPDFASQSNDVQRLHELYHSFFSELKQSDLIADYISIKWIEMFYSSVVEAAIKMLEGTGEVEDHMFIAWNSFWNGIKK